MGIIKGSDLNLYVEINNQQTPFLHAQNCQVTFTGDLIETTTKDGSRAKRYEYGGYGITLKLSGISILDDAANFYVLQNCIINAIKLPFSFGANNNTSIFYVGTLLVQNNSMDTDYKSLSTYSSDLVVDGELTTFNASTQINTNFNGIWDDDNDLDEIFQDV